MQKIKHFTSVGLLLMAFISIAMVSQVLGATADLRLTVSDSPDPVVVGGNLTYTFLLTNRGPDTATGILLTNALLPTVILGSVITTNGSWTNLGGVFKYSLASLPTGVLVSVKLVLTPVNLQTLTNKAYVSAIETDPVPGNNLAGGTTAVLPVVTGANLQRGREQHMATKLLDGRILITGGWTNSIANATASAELYNPATEIFVLTGEMTVGRYGHTATLLTNGMVLVAGGNTNSGNSSAVDTYNPTNGLFTLATNMSVPRSGHSATLLADGRVLLAGGHESFIAVEIYDPSNGSMTVSGNLLSPRAEHVAALLPDGKVLFAGGSATNPPSAEIFDPQTGVSVAAPNMLTNHPTLAGVRLLDGRVLIVGGERAELFDPITGAFSLVGPQFAQRNSSCITLLKDGRVLLSGGGNAISYISSTEIYDPASGTFSSGPAMTRARVFHSAALLNDGRVLIAGGWDASLLNSSEIVALNVDMDNDGIADDWELTYGLNPAERNDAIQDADQDGHTNLQEYLAGTNPLDSASNMRISAVQTDATTIRINFTTANGKRYALEKTTNFLNASWETVTNNVPGSGGTVQVIDARAPTQIRQLYRVRLIP